MPALPDATYDRVSFKASHNSYAREEIPVVTQLSWRPSQSHTDGCRGLELDLQQSSRNWAWSVAHQGGYNSAADRQFATYLDLLWDWSDKSRNHDPITITLDLKATHFSSSDFRHYLDQYILRHLKRERIFTPGDLMGDSDDLVKAARIHGWPRLEDLKGKFVLCLSGDERFKKAYAARPKARLCFSDQNKGSTNEGDRPKVGKGSRIFFNFKIPEGTDWVNNLKWYRDQPGFVTRGYVLNGRAPWNHALGAGVNILASDKVRRYEWATVGDLPFRKRR